MAFSTTSKITNNNNDNSNVSRGSSNNNNLNLSKFDGIVLGVFKDGTLSQTIGSNKLPGKFQQTIKKKLEYYGCSKGNLGECKLLYGIDKINDDAAVDVDSGNSFPKKIAIVGLGKRRDFKNPSNDQELCEALEIARNASAVGVRSLRENNAKNILVDVMTNEHGAAEGAILGLYNYDTLKSLSWETGLIYAEAQNFARTLMEAPANYMTPTNFTEYVQSKFNRLSNVEIIVRDKDWVEEKKMGSFLSVSKGSDEPLKFLEMHYKGGSDKSSSSLLALVGKGVTFDSGGISLKPSSNMSEMKADMGGGAAVSASLYGIAKLRLPINVVATIPLCENMPSGYATKPGDVVIAMNGKSIEVGNTDAEGRLILADALYYTSSTFKPHTLIDMATLTGAMGVALGNVYSGVFTNSNVLWQQLSSSSKKTNDRFWRMPLEDAYKKGLEKSSVADLVNVGGDSEIGGVRIKDADELNCIRYAHIDIASVMLTTDDSDERIATTPKYLLEPEEGCVSLTVIIT
ncbi:17168_t:CDS:2 [Entrophospora sp. SA101]|nr:17168_t:CDS:2 [Entrophospora sp. SA101]